MAPFANISVSFCSPNNFFFPRPPMFSILTAENTTQVGGKSQAQQGEKKHPDYLHTSCQLALYAPSFKDVC